MCKKFEEYARDNDDDDFYDEDDDDEYFSDIDVDEDGLSRGPNSQVGLTIKQYNKIKIIIFKLYFNLRIQVE